MTDTVLCVDIGTTSLKSGLISTEGEVVFLCVETFLQPDDDHIALQWLDSFKLCADKVRNFCDANSFCIKALSVSGNGPTVVTQEGGTVRWNEDTTFYKLPEVAKSSLFIPKLLCLKERFNDEYLQSQYIFSGPEYFIWKLTGSACTILPESRYKAAYWNEKMLMECGFDKEKLPPYVEIGTKVGQSDTDYAKGLGFGSLPVFAGGPDFIVAIIGTNTLESGRLCDRAGSSEGINYCSSKRVAADGIRLLPSVMSECWNLSALQTESGRLLADFKKKLEDEGKYSFINYTDFFNYLLDATEGNAYEIVTQICVQMKDAFERLKTVLEKNNLPVPKRMHTTGGQTKNELWMQKKADTLGIELAVCNCNDCELIGDACAAFTGLGYYSSIKQAANSLVKETKVYYPYENI